MQKTIAHVPPGFVLRHSLRGHEEVITRLSWDPAGARLASAAQDGTIRIWDGATGKLLRRLAIPGTYTVGPYWMTSDFQSAIAWRPAWLPDGNSIACGYGDANIRLWNVSTGEIIRTLEGHTAKVNNVVVSPDGAVLASGADDNTVKLWDVKKGVLMSTLEGHHGGINNLAWHPDGRLLASGSLDSTVRVWDTKTSRTVKTLRGHEEMVITVTWSPGGDILASSSGDGTIRLWDASTGLQRNVLEGHVGSVSCISFSYDGMFLASKAIFPDSTVRIWRVGTWDVLASLHEPSGNMWFAGLSFHPTTLTLATLDKRDTAIRIWDLDANILLGSSPGTQAVKYSTAKIVLLGDSGVGKTGLGWRLAHGFFSEQPSTHGQQFWLVDELAGRMSDGRECEAVLWDLAGQPDYRLVHSLFLDDVDLGLLVFDPTDRERPFSGVQYWLKQISFSRGQIIPSILVGARIDRGVPTVTANDLQKYCDERGITGGYVGTSAKDGTGMADLVKKIRSQLDWNKIPATVTSTTFKRIKGCVLSLKADSTWKCALVSPKLLHKRLLEIDPGWDVELREMLGAVKFLQNHGYVRLLKEPSGRPTILLLPDLLMNLAASIVLSARGNAEGLGALEEDALLKGNASFPELRQLTKNERHTLVNSAIGLFLEKNICFRESVGGKTYLVFPSLINDKPPSTANDTTEDTVYRVSGAVENLYASLVVLLGYTNTFVRTQHWQNQAEYALVEGQVCGFKQVEIHDGETELTLYSTKGIPEYARLLFRGLFEKFLSECDVVVVRLPVISCPECSEIQERKVVSRQLARERPVVYCSYCGTRIRITEPHDSSTLSLADQKKLTMERGVASRRTAFESAIVWVKSSVRGRRTDGAPPICFISYSWGVAKDGRWVRTLASDLRNAGVNVVFDRWHNTPGTSINKFIDRIGLVDFVLAIGTPEYRSKYDTELADPVVDAELRLIGTRLRKRSEERERVIPLLLSGEHATSFPPQFEDSVYLDFRMESQYFARLFDFVLTLFGIPFDHVGVDDLRDSLASAAI